MASAIPPRPVGSVVEWCKQNVKLIGSARSESYNPDITPWTKEPLECADNGTRSMTHVKPIQSGGSAEGECAIAYWLATQNGGDIQYNWQNDQAADDRWTKRFERILKACPAVMARAPGDRHKWTKGLIAFPHLNFIMQGVLSDRNVASDSICRQVNEELHDVQGGWSEGRLAQAHGRLTAYWNSIAFQISNAGYDGSDLHKIFLAGTQQHWEVKCPGCGLYHRMRALWEDENPQLGGLRYDSKTSKRDDGSHDYNRLQSTLRYQMPCGYEVRDDIAQRRALSLSGKYSVGDNPGAVPTEKSYTLQAVSVDYIPWIELVKQKHGALKAVKYGKSEPWSIYLRERECQFYKPGNTPVVHNIVTSKRKKDRAGLPDRMLRLASGDYQQGEAAKGELPHWWHLIADIAIEADKIHVLIVSDGKLTTDENLVDAFKRHEVIPSCVILDSGWNAKHVYELCLRHGYYAVKGEDTDLFAGHPDGSRKIYSPPKPLHAMINFPPVHPYKLTREGHIPDPNEPMFIRYSKYGLLDRQAWLRTSKSVNFEVPSDVSQDFKAHMESWRLEKRFVKRTNREEPQWVQRRDRDDLLSCLCYICLLMEDAGVIGGDVIESQAESGQSQEETK